MAQDNSNSTMEMGTSDQVLVATKKKKTLTLVVGFIAMLVGIAVVITLVVVLSGNDNAVGEPIITTEGPTTPTTMPPLETTTTSTPIPVPTTTPESTTTPDPEGPTTTTTLAPVPTTTTPAPEPTTDVPTTAEPQPDPILLEDIINGVFAVNMFNGTWTSENDILLRNANGDLVLYDVDTDSTTVLVSNSTSILQQSSRVTQLSADGSQVVLAYNVEPVYRYSFLARYAAIDIVSGTVVNIAPPGVSAEEAFLQNFVWGPSGTSLSFVYLNNIYYQASLTAQPQVVTTNGQLNVIYNGIPDWVYEEEVFVSNNALWFSNDGSKLAFATFDDTDVRVMKVPHFGVPGSINYQYTQHHEIRYPKPGTTNPTVYVTFRDIESGNETIYYAPTDLNEPILKPVTFVGNESIALMWTNRVQTTMIVELCTPPNTACTRIFNYAEQDGWIDNIPLIFNEQGNAFITILPQAVNNVLYKQIVQIAQVGTSWALTTLTNRINTPHTVAEIMVWTSDDIIWYKATHVNDSAEQHIYFVNGTNVQCFTCEITRPDGGQCLYNDATISSGGSRVIVNCAGPDVPQVYVYDMDGTRVMTWDENAETASLLMSYNLPETLRLSVPVVADFPPADVLLQVPSDYQTRNNVPLLVYVYGGPDTAMVTKAWNIDWGTSLVTRWGIAIAHIDGRGSGLRGVANMFALNRQLGTVEIEDQISVTRSLHLMMPWLDSNRTCIWGWSYGGYASSLALARGGDVFRCAAAVAPVVDWRFYDTIYTERYMDLPQTNPQAYANSSLLTEQVVEAFRDKRYFLIHGTADDNVHYQHAMLISRLLQRQDVYFTQMSYTDEDHSLVGVRPHLYHALEKFLQENML